MKAIGFTRPLPIDAAGALESFDLPVPVATGRDILVKVEAVSVNPVDTKIRRKTDPAGTPRVLGWDAAGVVSAIGPEVSLSRVGDRVWYAGDISRPGSNAEYQLVDERIAALMPSSLSFETAAAMPLTSITAWELLFDRFGVMRGRSDAGVLLITGGAGGVGSMLIQLARQLTGLTVIATASRPETADWCRSLGAHHVVDHSRDLAAEVRGLGMAAIDYAASLTATEQHYGALVDLLAPQGKLGLIDDPATPLDIMPLKRKSLSLHWELMFTRSLFQTPDMIQQHRLLTEVARLVDAGVLRTTHRETVGRIDVPTLTAMHGRLESGRTLGKLVAAGF